MMRPLINPNQTGMEVVNKNNPAIRILLYCYYFLRFLVHNFRQDYCLRFAAALGYTTLLSLVPFLTIAFVILAAFPFFEAITVMIQEFIVQNFIPATGAQVQIHLQEFTQKAMKLSGVGIALLVLVAIMLMGTIESVFNTIWHIKRDRPFVSRLTLYWTVLTLGPILLAVSFSISSYLISLPFIAEGSETVGTIKTTLLGVMPLLATILALTLVYIVVPNCKVPMRHALVSAFVAGLFFELAKKGFTLYVANATTYATLYGALAVVPLFLIWIYLSWVIVLLGAEISYCLTYFHEDEESSKALAQQSDA